MFKLDGWSSQGVRVCFPKNDVMIEIVGWVVDEWWCVREGKGKS